MKIHYMGAVAQELSGRDADVNVVSNQQMQLTMAAAGRIPVEQCDETLRYLEYIFIYIYEYIIV